MIRIGIDANGGDNGVLSTVPAAITAVEKYKDIEITLYGDETKIKPLLTNSERIKIVHTAVTMDMGEHDPVRAVRTMKDSSLDMVMYAAKNNEVDAVVTSGPTQCVIMAAHVIIRRLPGMERVALCPIVPNYDKKPRLLLDVGANVELRPEHFGEFSIYASVVAKEILNIENPTVGLLNIGSEPGKGREIDQEAYKYLENLKEINFKGNIEPNQIINSPTDIIVCDGFTGNIALKTLEGTAKCMGTILKEEIGHNIFALFLKKKFKRFKKRFDSKEVGGAMITGIKVPVIKAHGNSDDYAFFNAIRQAYQMVSGDVINKVINKLPKKEENHE